MDVVRIFDVSSISLRLIQVLGIAQFIQLNAPITIIPYRQLPREHTLAIWIKFSFNKVSQTGLINQ